MFNLLILTIGFVNLMAGILTFVDYMTHPLFGTPLIVYAGKKYWFWSLICLLIYTYPMK